MADAKMQVVIDLVDNASQKISGLKGSLQNISDKAKSLAVGFSAFGAAGAFALKQTIDASNELNNALVGLSSVATAFNANVNEAKEAAIALASDGLMSVKDSANSLKNLLATGFSLPEAIELMYAFKDAAAFNRQGTLAFGQAIEGATQGIKNQNSILVDNAGITKNLSNILSEAGFSMQDLSKVTSDASVRAALYNGILKEASAFQGDAAKLGEQLSGEMAKLSTQFFNVKAALGDALAPTLASTFGSMSKLLEGVLAWIKKNPELAATIAKVTAAVVAFTIAMGALLLVIAVLSSPISLIVAGIGLLIAALIFFVKTIKENMDTVVAVFSAMGNAVVNKLKEMVEGLKAAWNAIIEFFAQAWEIIKEIFMIGVKTALWPVFLAFEIFNTDITGVMQSLSDTISGIWGGVKDFFVEKSSEMKQTLINDAQTLKTTLANTWNNIKAAHVAVWTFLVEDIGGKMKEIVSTILSSNSPILEAFDKIWDGVKAATNAAFEFIKSSLKSMVNFFIDTINAMIKVINAALSKVAGAIGKSAPSIPTIPLLAKGGIVTKPTLAMVGEDGAEAVIPLNKANNPGGIGLGSITINITGTFLSEDAAEKMADMVINQLKLSSAVV